MNRREFVKDSLLLMGGSAVSSPLALRPSRAAASLPSSRKLVIDYPRKNVPPITSPASRGEWYEELVPDTLDIATRAELAIHALTSITDPNADYEVYWETQLFRNPPIMMHDHNDWVQSVEGFMEALPLLRAATGSSLNGHVDPVWMRVSLQCIGPDGLSYEVLNGTPWSRLNPWSFHKVWRTDGSLTGIEDPSLVFATTPSKCARMLGTMTVYYLRDQNPLWKQTCERMIQRLVELAVEGDRFTYLPNWAFEPYAKCGANPPMPTGWDAVDYGNVRLIQGLTQHYRLSGFEPARKLAAGLTAFGMHHAEYYDEQGRFLFSDTERKDLLTSNRMQHRYPEAKDARLGGHFHNHTIGALSMLEYGVAVHDRNVLEFVNSGYQWAKTQGSSLVGFFPEMIINGRYLVCESCEVADMIGIGIKLSTAGVGDYWDDIDRWVRNTFAEQQLTDGRWFYEFSETQPAKPVAYNETAEGVAERNIGAFAGWASGNEWAAQIGIQQCCLGNSARALYYVLENMVQRQDQSLRVNLLLNRATPWADIYSHVPYEGRVELKIKKNCDMLWVRAPEWCGTGTAEIACRVNGAPRKLAWDGRYVQAGHAVPSDRIVIMFPIAERTVKERIGDVPYTLTIKGSTVTSIDPPGRHGALYNRAYFRQPQAPMKKVNRFVPEETIVW